MNGEAIVEFFKFLGRFDPLWVAIILAVIILSYRVPEIVRAFKGRR